LGNGGSAGENNLKIAKEEIVDPDKGVMLMESKENIKGYKIKKTRVRHGYTSVSPPLLLRGGTLLKAM
jgi:hypothetical protein